MNNYTLSKPKKDALRRLLSALPNERVGGFVSAMEHLIARHLHPIGELNLTAADRRKNLLEFEAALSEASRLLWRLDLAGPLTEMDLARKDLSLHHDLYSAHICSGGQPAEFFAAIRQMQSGLQVIKGLPAVAVDALPREPKRSNDPRKRRMEIFDLNIMLHYWASFGAYPALSDDGSFMSVVDILYSELGESTSSIRRRMTKARDAHQQMLSTPSARN